MDIFCEQIVRKISTTKDKVLKALVAVGVFALSAVCIFLSLLIPSLSMIGLLLVFGICYGGYYLMTGFSCEYEYIVTNGEIDVDKIIAKRKRVRLITAKAPVFETFGEFTDNTPAAAEGTTIVNAVGENETEAGTKDYYADFKHASAGQVRLIFSPEERVVDAIVPFLPAQVRVNLKKQQQ